MIALNCSNVGVSRIGFSRLAERRCAAGEDVMMRSRIAASNNSLAHEMCRLRDAEPNRYRDNHKSTSLGLIFPTWVNLPVGQSFLNLRTMSVFRSIVFGF